MQTGRRRGWRFRAAPRWLERTRHHRTISTNSMHWVAPYTRAGPFLGEHCVSWALRNLDLCPAPTLANPKVTIQAAMALANASAFEPAC